VRRREVARSAVSGKSLARGPLRELELDRAGTRAPAPGLADGCDRGRGQRAIRVGHPGPPGGRALSDLRHGWPAAASTGRWAGRPRNSIRGQDDQEGQGEAEDDLAGGPAPEHQGQAGQGDGADAQGPLVGCVSPWWSSPSPTGGSAQAPQPRPRPPTGRCRPQRSSSAAGAGPRPPPGCPSTATARRGRPGRATRPR
jgi:hypothetical protein